MKTVVILFVTAAMIVPAAAHSRKQQKLHKYAHVLLQQDLPANSGRLNYSATLVGNTPYQDSALNWGGGGGGGM